jgi:hypothetical protein
VEEGLSWGSEYTAKPITTLKKNDYYIPLILVDLDLNSCTNVK